MERNTFEICDIDQLPKTYRELCHASIEARDFSYSPYSKFQVGAALLTSSSEIVRGCNVENVSYGLAICAERCALTKAVSELTEIERKKGGLKFEVMAVCANSYPKKGQKEEDKENFATPCGACRQFIVEFNPNMIILLVNPQTMMVKKENMYNLLPNSFLPEMLNRVSD